MANVVQDKMVISLAYTLRLANGDVIDYSEAGEPLEYLHGAGNIIPSLEKALVGLRIGDTKEVEIPPEDAYGPYDPEDVLMVDTQQFPSNLPLRLGMALEVSDDEGNVMEAFVREIGPRHITLDFNHPLAGQALFFSVEVINVREATATELAHGHPHGAGHDHESDEDESPFEFYVGDLGDDDDPSPQG